jgi:hypothetical protein
MGVRGQYAFVAMFLLTWNPDSDGWPEDDYAAAVEATAVGAAHESRWSVGIRRSGVSVGDRAYMVRQRHERGIVASAFASEIYEDEHWDGSGRMTTYADVAFDVVLPATSPEPDVTPTRPVRSDTNWTLAWTTSPPIISTCISFTATTSGPTIGTWTRPSTSCMRSNAKG